MKGQALRGISFQLALLGYAAVGVSVLNPLFNTTTRWFFLALLGGTLLIRGKLFLALGTRLSFTVGLYCVWCMTTFLWSEIPALSLMKSVALAATIITFVSAGKTWVRYWRPDLPLGFLMPIIPVALLAGFGPNGESEQSDTGFAVYYGLAGNPNFLGMLAALGCPLALWLAYTTQHGRKKITVRYGLSIGLLLLLAVILIRSGSRASLLCFVMIGISFVMALRPERRLALFLYAALVGIGAIIAVPAIQQSTYQRFVIKGAQDNDLFYSRRQPWIASLDAAEQGGILGVGYGVSAGDANFKGGLTAELYGREKGNAQLAVWEETGLIGLALYVVLLAQMIWYFAFSLKAMRTQDERVQFALLLGILLGLLVQSGFEAWWSAPGSLEASYFWATVGVALGLRERVLGHQHAIRTVPLPRFGLNMMSRSVSRR